MITDCRQEAILNLTNGQRLDQLTAEVAGPVAVCFSQFHVGDTPPTQVADGGIAKMKTPISKTCSATKTNQSNCQTTALPGSEFCFFHDPAKAEERREAQAKGGRQNRMKTLDPTAPDVKVEDCRDARALLVLTINQVLKGEIDPRVANTVGFLANILLKAMEQNMLETRIEQLEALLKVQTTTFDLTLTGA